MREGNQGPLRALILYITILVTKKELDLIGYVDAWRCYGDHEIEPRRCCCSALRAACSACSSRHCSCRDRDR